jgi:mannan endo-1,4-beta-mannosidase
MAAGKRLFNSCLGLASCVTIFYMSFGDLLLGHMSVLVSHHQEGQKFGFVERNGSQFMLDGRAFYINGWNSFWLMDKAVDEYSRPRVREMLQAGAKMGLTVCRTWAFNDGTFNALQLSPGHFDERVFQVLEHSH